MGFFVDASTTLPVNVPVPSCATAGDADSRIATTRMETAPGSGLTATAIAIRFKPTLSIEKSKRTRKQEVSILASTGHLYFHDHVFFFILGPNVSTWSPPGFRPVDGKAPNYQFVRLGFYVVTYEVT